MFIDKGLMEFITQKSINISIHILPSTGLLIALHR